MNGSTETAYDVFLYHSAIVCLYIPEGARLSLLKHSVGNDLFTSQLLIQEFHRIKIGEESIAKERRGFESWIKLMRHIPKKPVKVNLLRAIISTLEELYAKMYTTKKPKMDSEEELKVKKLFASYLISHGLLMLSCNESGVAK